MTTVTEENLNQKELFHFLCVASRTLNIGMARKKNYNTI